MTEAVDYRVNSASAQEIERHLERCDANFTPPLSERVRIREYSNKVAGRAERFEAWDGERLVGLVAAYCNDMDRKTAYVTSVSVLHEWAGRNIASELICRFVRRARTLGMTAAELEAARRETRLTRFYSRFGFVPVHPSADGSHVLMRVDLVKQMPTESYMTAKRDYDAESRDVEGGRYAYGFDFDVMHPFILRAFEPFFREGGQLLELGSYKGDFTRILLESFEDVTCVEASSEAIDDARRRLGEGRVSFVPGVFETVELPGRFDNIVMTHVLEHLDDPVRVLTRVNDEWLAKRGRFFLACPNANAPSRQIAVKMGLISHNAAVTPTEAEHGHRRTYALDTLERDAVAAGLRVIQRGGVFFKALANFQWDRLLATDIISPEYLEGCYTLGQSYPGLCSSIFLICESA